MIKVYGYSDDLVEVEGVRYPFNEIGCFEKDVRIRFMDGTVIRVGYPKADCACWWIEVEEKGTAKQSLTVCNDDEAEIYSDVFEIDSVFLRASVIKRKYGGRK